MRNPSLGFQRQSHFICGFNATGAWYTSESCRTEDCPPSRCSGTQSCPDATSGPSSPDAHYSNTSFLAWKSAQHHTETSNNTITALLGPICEFVGNGIRYQLKKHSITIKLPGLQEMKERELETQKHILQLTETITRLSEHVAILSSRPVPTATSTIVKTMMTPTPRQNSTERSETHSTLCTNLCTGAAEHATGIH